MPSQTSYAQLWLYNNAEDKQQLFESFRENLDGTAATSNMMKIDSLLSQANTRMTAAEGDIDTLQSDVSSAKSSITELESDVGNLQNAITELQNDSSLTTAKATSTDNSNYTATVEGMTEYKTNMVMVIYLGSTNTGAVTVNVNSLGAKNLMKIGSAGTAVALEAEDMKANVGYLFQYDGTQFVLLQEVTVKDLYKTFLEFEETDEVVPPAPIDADRLGGIPAANYLQKIYNAGSNNLLVNPRFKYNSRSQQSYSSSSGDFFSLDGWIAQNPGGGTTSVSANSGGGITLTTSVANQGIKQIIYKSKLPSGTYTISILVNGTVCSETFAFSGSDVVNSYTGQNFSYAVVSVTSDTYAIFPLVEYLTTQQSYTITAVKLERGSASTLQAEINNPPPEDLEKLKLDMYDLDPGRCAYLPWRNENLLDNWYFVGGGSQQGGGQFPINQKGQTSYITTISDIYTIDRWSISNGSSFSIEDDGILFTPTNQSNYMLQKDERTYVGETVTLSFLTEHGLFCSSYKAATADPFVYDKTNEYGETIRIQSLDNIWLSVFFSGTSSDKVYAAKLELGYLSTLARKDEEGSWVLNDPPPNFQQELAKCQRYQIALDKTTVIAGRTYVGVETSVLCFLPTPVTMRINPTWVGDIENIAVYSNGNAYTATSIINVDKATNGIAFTVKISSGVGVKQPIIAELRPDGIFDANL